MKQYIATTVAGVTLALTLCLSACGGGGGSSAVPTANAETHPNAVLIGAFGDSTMAGFTATSPTTGEYTTLDAPHYLQLDLQGIYGPGVTVVNQGVSASTLGELMAGTAPYTTSFTQQLAQSNAKIVLENFGMNDVLPGVGESPEAFRQLLIEWVTDAINAGEVPILEEPSPSCDPQRANLGEYVQQIDDVAAQMNVPLIQQYTYIQSLPNWQGYLADCIHPSPALYAIKAQREAVVISPLVAKLLD
jgi:lysophospholipase L1-like esterase